jgi:uncharacterized protein (TIGR02246 family)
MRNAIIATMTVSLSLFIATSCTTVQQDDTKTRDAIAEVNKQFVSAFEQGDAEGVAALYTEGGQILPPGSAIITGKEGIAAFWTGAMGMGIKRAELSTLELDPQGDTAIEVGRATLYSEAGDVIDNPKFIVVWKREAGQWKLHRDIWNSDKAQ